MITKILTDDEYNALLEYSKKNPDATRVIHSVKFNGDFMEVVANNSEELDNILVRAAESCGKISLNGDRVNHPSYYKNPAGIECFDVIRYMPTDIAFAVKYLWRQGNKSENGMEDVDKAAEDCNKAICCINDYIEHILNKPCLYKHV